MPGAEQVLFLLYAAAGVVVFGLYAGLPAGPSPSSNAARAPLARSRPIVLRLTALFTLDAFAGGFVVQALLVLWLSRRFQLPADTTALVFFVVGLCGALSQLVSARLAARIGLIQTMVYTHLPANLLLILAGVMPRAELAVGCLLARALLSQMDVPARQAYVMAVVPPEERAAAASVTAVPRSLATAVPPLFVGWLLDHSTFGWPLICAGILKAVYDVLLLVQFRDHPTQPG